MNKAPSFFAVARQPKWIGALLLALAVAAIFALLSQWQLDRTFTKDLPEPVAYAVSSVDVKIDTKNVYVVANRLNGSKRGGELGYWLIANSTDAKNKSQTLALGWSPDLAEVEGERNALIDSGLEKVVTHLEGIYIPSEAPQPQKNSKNYIFESLSLPQLINVYSPDKTLAAEPEVLALCGCSQASAWAPLQSINVTYAEGQKINWLSAFYFLEWLLFAGFAVFLWWRLVKDEQILLAAEQSSEKVN
jgi:hypothetical protein